jgi:hypothetical protein
MGKGQRPVTSSSKPPQKNSVKNSDKTFVRKLTLLIHGTAVHVEGQLQFEEVAVFSQAKANALQSADVALFPIGSVQCFLGQIVEGPIHGRAVDGEGFGIEVVDFFVADVQQQVALPETEQQKTFAVRFVEVPGLGCVFIEFDDGERELSPGGFSGGFGLREERSEGCEEKNSSCGYAKNWRKKLFHFRARGWVMGKVYDRRREGRRGGGVADFGLGLTMEIPPHPGVFVVFRRSG